MSNIKTFATNMPVREFEKALELVQSGVDAVQTPEDRIVVQQGPVNNAQALRVMVRFALDNPESFTKWYIETEGEPVE